MFSEITIPVLSSFPSANLDMPTVGSAVMWILVAMLAGSVLGILREALWQVEPPADAPAQRCPATLGTNDQPHREAA